MSASNFISTERGKTSCCRQRLCPGEPWTSVDVAGEQTEGVPQGEDARLEQEEAEVVGEARQPPEQR